MSKRKMQVKTKKMLKIYLEKIHSDKSKSVMEISFNIIF